MPSLVVFGASGFLGRAFLAQEGLPLPVRAVTRAIPVDGSRAKGVTWMNADLTVPASLGGVLGAGDVVINLAYMPKGGEEANRRLVDALIEACLRARVARLVHCSTATVVGATSDTRVTETSPCVPHIEYEKTKWGIERQVTAATQRGLDAVILRPTAVVGPGGKNLRSLADSLRSDSPLVTYARASLFGSRPMHLVPVRDVAAALLHLATLRGALRGEVYQVSADDDPHNEFQSVEAILRDALGLPARRVPVLKLPRGVLSLLLALRGRSETNLQRVYVPDKLRGTGFRPTESIESAVRAFGASLGPST